jgi:hypothetical protein
MSGSHQNPFEDETDDPFHDQYSSANLGKFAPIPRPLSDYTDLRPEQESTNDTPMASQQNEQFEEYFEEPQHEEFNDMKIETPEEDFEEDEIVLDNRSRSYNNIDESPRSFDDKKKNNSHFQRFQRFAHKARDRAKEKGKSFNLSFRATAQEIVSRLKKSSEDGKHGMKR